MYRAWLSVVWTLAVQWGLKWVAFLEIYRAECAVFVSHPVTPFQVIREVGLCILLHDLLEVGDSMIYPGDGAAQVRVSFRMVRAAPVSPSVCGLLSFIVASFPHTSGRGNRHPADAGCTVWNFARTSNWLRYRWCSGRSRERSSKGGSGAAQRRGCS
jgi:hypothetical protein